MKKQTNQAGFAVLEVVLALVAVSIAGFIGYFVYHSNSTATDTYNQASETSATPVIKTKPATAKSTATSSASTSATPVSNSDAAKVKAAMTAGNPNSSQSTSDMNNASSSLNASEDQ